MSTENAKPKADGAESLSTDGLAAKIAREIFSIGDEIPKRGGHTQRLQFMGGRYPDAERPMGGLNEMALAAVIARVLTANVEFRPPSPLLAKVAPGTEG